MDPDWYRELTRLLGEGRADPEGVLASLAARADQVAARFRDAHQPGTPFLEGLDAFMAFAYQAAAERLFRAHLAGDRKDIAAAEQTAEQVAQGLARVVAAVVAGDEDDFFSAMSEVAGLVNLMHRQTNRSDAPSTPLNPARPPETGRERPSTPEEET